MYLLMLLATFMAAIYGYNLSARPEYDRDIVRKRALSVLTRFDEQHRYVEGLVSRIRKHRENHELPLYVLPDDVVTGGDNPNNPNNKYLLIYKQNHELAKEKFEFYQKKIEGESTSGNYMPLGKKLYPADEMATKVVCLKTKLYCSTGSEFGCDGNRAETCDILIDASDPSNRQISDTCCKAGASPGGKYLVTFKAIDAKWLSRITGKISMDFMEALQSREFNQNVGIINWENGAWKFQGKLRFLPSYEEAKLKWEADPAHSDSDYFPSKEKNKTVWILPSFFGEDFFKVNGEDMCEKGCIFHIEDF